MPWVKFWAATNCPSRRDDSEPDHVEYVWHDEPIDENDEKTRDIMKDDAHERAPSWMQGLERGYRYGWEVLDPLPNEVRLKLIKSYERRKYHVEKMLAILEGRTPPPPLEERTVPTRLDRV